jgi:mannan endo-1,4-beta-mannosidase
VKSLALLLLSTSAAFAADFVRVDGTHFELGNRPFVFVGANLEVMHGPANRAAAADTIAAASRDGLTVGRIWALGEGPAGAPADRATMFRAGPDVTVDEAIAQLDRVVAAATKSGLRLVVVLSNHWGDYGGLPMYLRWFGLDPERDHDRFYDDPRIRAAYLAHVERIVARYADNPTILAWELINEAHVHEDPTKFFAFVDDAAARIKKLAPRQLVSAGVFGYGTRAERAVWLGACRRPQVDFCDSHFYAETSDLIGTPAELDDAFDDRAQLAHFVAKKPLVLGEIGFDTRRATPWFLGLSRSAWFNRALRRIRYDAIDGVMVWIYQPFATTERDFGIYTDRGSTDDVRAILRAAAATPLGAVNPRLGPAGGEKPLYAVYKTLSLGDKIAADTDGVVSLDPTRPNWARFERAGRYEPPAPARPHAYGDGDGSFRWKFRLARAAQKIRVDLRASAESPGTAGTIPSDFLVRLDGKVIARLHAPADDGAGIPLSAEARAALKPGPHTLSVEVPSAPTGHGLCLYGPEPITLRLSR